MDDPPSRGQNDVSSPLGWEEASLMTRPKSVPRIGISMPTPRTVWHVAPLQRSEETIVSASCSGTPWESLLWVSPWCLLEGCAPVRS